MKNKEIVFWNLEKKELFNIKNNARYVLFTDNDVDVSKFNIKPIVIKYHGAYIVDMENNKVIYSGELSKDKINQIKIYANKHDVNYIMKSIDKKIYEIELMTSNYFRMLVMPAFIKNEYRGLTTYYNYPYTLDNKNYFNYIVNDNISILESILKTINYLKLESNDILELTNICFTLVDIIMNKGYCMTNYDLKIKSNQGLLVESGNLI